MSFIFVCVRTLCIWNNFFSVYENRAWFVHLMIIIYCLKESCIVCAFPNYNFSQYRIRTKTVFCKLGFFCKPFSVQILGLCKLGFLKTYPVNNDSWSFCAKLIIIIGLCIISTACFVYTAELFCTEFVQNRLCT